MKPCLDSAKGYSAGASPEEQAHHFSAQFLGAQSTHPADPESRRSRDVVHPAHGRSLELGIERLVTLSDARQSALVAASRKGRW